MNYSHTKQPILIDGKKIRCSLTFKGTRHEFGMLFTNNKAKSKRLRRQKLRDARVARERVKAEVRQYRENKGISSTQFADKLLSFSSSTDRLLFLAMVSPTCADMQAGLGIS
jgi:hypothetical protein